MLPGVVLVQPLAIDALVPAYLLGLRDASQLQTVLVLMSLFHPLLVSLFHPQLL